MKARNVKELDLDAMLDRAKITAAILEIAYNLQEVEDYTRENAAQDLIQFLADLDYLEEVKKQNKRRGYLMNKNLAFEMLNRGISAEIVANVINCSVQEVTNKIFGLGTIYDEAEEREIPSQFYANEVYQIGKTLFPGVSLDYLFD